MPMGDVSERVQALLDQMTLEEKLNQLSAYMFFDTFWNNHGSTSGADRVAFIESVEPGDMIPESGLGFITTQLRDLPPRKAAEMANKDQDYCREHTRMKIPLVIHDEGLHGLIGNGATVFPSALGMAASFNPELFGRIATAIGREARSRGVRQVLSPTVNLGLDPRCGRTEETYGEDPLIASRMGAAYIRGVQGEGVICTPKHFVANFEAEGGRDSWAAHFSERMMREVFFPPFEAAVREAGALSLMNAYNSIDGVPCAGSHWLLTEILRDEWGFDGYVVSDYVSVILQMKVHKTAATMEDAAKHALEAGLDVELPRFECFGEPLQRAVENKRVSMDTIDQAVGRVLMVKERIGLFDDDRADADEAERLADCEEHRGLAREMARQSLVLLKNEGRVLPFGERIRSLAVIGPNADSIELGDYTYDLYTKNGVVTPLAGIRAAAPEGVTIHHAEGCGLSDDSEAGFEEAIGLAKESDVAVMAMGSSVKLAGEARDRTDLALPGKQAELIRRVADTGTPVVVIIVSGSVHTLRPWIDDAAAIFQAWYLGEEGGTAIGEALFGMTNPSGKLPITIPRSTGQCPVYYFHKPSGRNHSYKELGQQGAVEFPFGHGLSYTKFEYTDLRIMPRKMMRGGKVQVGCTLRNSGRRAGVETVQLYLHDQVGCVARPRQELKDFQRVELESGERKKVTFTLASKDLEFYGPKMEKVLEPGTIEVMIGSSCLDIRAEGEFDIV